MGASDHSLGVLHGSGWAREFVIEEPASQSSNGDYAVGTAFLARYTYTLPCGRRRLALDQSVYVEDLLLLGTEDRQAYGINERFEVREERLVANEWEEHRELTTFSALHTGSLVYRTYQAAEDDARRWTLMDDRAELHAPVMFVE